MGIEGVELHYKDLLFEEILPRVSKPGQYAGGERNTIVKDHASVDLKVALAFPDTYGIGMSHLGLKILYHMLNARDDIVAERVFAPWTDMEDRLRQRDLPLTTLETFTPLEFHGWPPSGPPATPSFLAADRSRSPSSQ